MQPIRVRLVESATVAQLEHQLNATLAELEDDPAVAAIESVTYRPDAPGKGGVSAMIVYRLAPPAPREAEAVAAAEAIVQDEQNSGI